MLQMAAKQVWHASALVLAAGLSAGICGRTAAGADVRGAVDPRNG
jgi:hypothetical protein